MANVVDRKTVLVVDDDKHTRSLLVEILSGENLQVLEAEDGHQAYELIKKQRPDLLITDRAMPIMGGLELLQKLRKDRISLPVLMVSAYGEESLWGEAIRLGAQDYILKPFKTHDVVAVVRKMLFGGKKS